MMAASFRIGNEFGLELLRLVGLEAIQGVRSVTVRAAVGEVAQVSIDLIASGEETATRIFEVVETTEDGDSNSQSNRVE